MSQNRWAPGDYGLAMEAAVLQHALPKCVRRRGDKLWFNGFHRAGDDPNCVLDVARGNWSDLKTGEHGIARDFAGVFLGMSVREMMDRWGPVYQAGPRAARPVADPRPVATCRWNVEDLWDALVGAMPDPRDDPASRWLTAVRGFPPQVSDLIPSGFASVCRGQISVFPEGLRSWIAKRIRVSKALIAAPLRDAATGAVANIQFRGLAPSQDPDDNGRRWLPDGFLSDPATGTPYGYGDAYRARTAEVVVVVEGMADCMAVEAMLAPHPECCAIGVASSSTFIHWQRWLKRKTRGSVVVACQLDRPDRQGRRVGIERAAELVDALDAAGVPADFFDWSRFLRLLDMPTRDPPIKDVADAVKIKGWEPAKDAFVAVLGASIGRHGRSGRREAQGEGTTGSQGGRAPREGDPEGHGPPPA